MYFKIERVILWPKKTSLSPVVIKFELDKVNVITGQSRTGKSAIIPIIDYCLGSSRCFIPVEIIRNSCEWFGIVVQLENCQILLARKSPEGKSISNEFFYSEKPYIDLNKLDLVVNASTEFVKDQLNTKLGLSYLDISNGQGDSFKARVSIRDIVKVCFQAQHIIANQFTMFYQIDSYEYRERLRNYFPLIIGAVTNEIIEKQHLLQLKIKELRKKESQLDSFRKNVEHLNNDLISYVLKASALGLIDDDCSDLSNINKVHNLLMKLVENEKTVRTLQQEKVSSLSSEINVLMEQENNLANIISKFNNKLNKLTQLKSSSNNAMSTHKTRKQRLEISKWLIDNNNQNSEIAKWINSEELDSKLKELSEAFKYNEQMILVTPVISSSIDSEIAYLNNIISDKTDEINAIRMRIEILKSNNDINDNLFSYESSMQLIGEIRASYKFISNQDDDSELVKEISSLRSEIKKLEDEASTYKVNRNTHNKLQQLGKYSLMYLQSLDIEAKYRAKAPLFSINDLTYKIEADDEQSYFMSEIGSGSNYVSLHIALSLALQKLISKQENNPTPSFIIFDQPSQVYFPREMVENDDLKNVDINKGNVDEDVRAVRKIFDTLSTFVGDVDSQVIIMDHVAENIWGSCPNTHKVDEWRDGKTLIPKEWLS